MSSFYVRIARAGVVNCINPPTTQTVKLAPLPVWGPRQQRRFAAVEATGQPRWRQAPAGPILVPGSKTINQSCGGYRAIHRRIQGSIATAWYGTGVGILESKAVEVVILNQGGHAMFQAALLGDPREAILFSKWLLTETKQAVDPAEGLQRGDRSRRSHRPSAGGGCPRAPGSRARASAEGVGGVRCNSHRPAVGHGLGRLQQGGGRQDA